MHMGMYPVMDAAVAASADPAYMQSFVQDGLFLAPADPLRRRGRQSADYRFGGGRRRWG